MSQVIDLGSMHHLVVVLILILVFYLLIRKLGVFAPVDCKVSEWVNDGTCDSATGKLKQKRSVIDQPKNGGKACPTDLTQNVDCKVDCVMNPWVNDGTCNATTGKQAQKRTVLQQPKNGGTACPTDLTQEINCPTATPPAADSGSSGAASGTGSSSSGSGAASGTGTNSGFYVRREGYNARMYEGMYPHEPPVIVNTGYDENTNTGYIDDINSIESFSNKVKGPYE
jgi:hypothetical protein